MSYITITLHYQFQIKGWQIEKTIEHSAGADVIASASRLTYRKMVRAL